MVSWKLLTHLKAKRLHFKLWVLELNELENLSFQFQSAF